MLFSLTGEYTPQALNAMMGNPDTNRQAAVEQLVKAANGTVVGILAGAGVLLIAFAIVLLSGPGWTF